jgi:hypothetical protein
MIMRKLVLPGELVTKKDKRMGNGVRREDEAIHSTLLGLLDEKENYVRVIPLAGGYDPKEEDYVIGVVSDARSTFWRLDIAGPYSSILPGGEFFRELRGNEKLREISSCWFHCICQNQGSYKVKGRLYHSKMAWHESIKRGVSTRNLSFKSAKDDWKKGFDDQDSKG